MGASGAAAHAKPQLPAISLREKMMLQKGANDPDYFKDVVRPRLYEICGGDAETVQELVKDVVRRYQGIAGLVLPKFDPPKNIMVKMPGLPRKVAPVKPAEGLDKNFDVPLVLDHYFDVQQPGTVVVEPRKGNDRVRVVSANDGVDLYNAQGFPSEGLAYVVDRLREYGAGGKSEILLSIAGLPTDKKDPVGSALAQTEDLIHQTYPYVSGYIDNRWSPNTADLPLLQTEEAYRQTAVLMKQLVPHKLRLMKIGPYEPSGRDAMLALVKAFLDGGGHGVVTTNTFKVPKDQLPAEVRGSWGYPTAGRSGAFLTGYMLRSVRDIRLAFPDADITAEGGIFDGHVGYDAFKTGANSIAGFTVYARYGFGQAPRIMRQLSEHLERDGKTMEELQAEVKELARKGETMPSSTGEKRSPG